MKTRILIVEDDADIATVVAKNLEAVGYTCDAVHDGNEVLGAFERLEPALIILDIMLPGIDGLELTRQIRKQSAIPILMLTARATMADKVLGLELGADDYLTKPFGMQELVARVRALLRRTGQTSEEEIVERGELTIDPQRRGVRKNGEHMLITSLEFDLLYFLASHPGRVYSRDALMNHVWGEDRVVDTRSIDSLISRLRRKLEADPAKPRYIQTVWGAGYRFAETGS
jgi:DNA-binding response OmpR family regulator